MKISQGTVVSLQFRLHRSGPEGQLIDEATAAEPLVFLFGAEGILPALEEQLAGMEPDSSFTFTIPAKAAYGPYDPSLVLLLPIETFAVEGKVVQKLLQPGQTVPLENQSGKPVDGTVMEVNEKDVKVNLNHPLAGMDLYFQGKVIDVRAATAEETARGTSL